MAANVTKPKLSGDMYNERLLTDLAQSLEARDKTLKDGLKDLREDFVRMVEGFTKLKVVMDNGTLVGELVGPMDQLLGQRMAFEERGM